MEGVDAQGLDAYLSKQMFTPFTGGGVFLDVTTYKFFEVDEFASAFDTRAIGSPSMGSSAEKKKSAAFQQD